MGDIQNTNGAEVLESPFASHNQHRSGEDTCRSQAAEGGMKVLTARGQLAGLIPYHVCLNVTLLPRKPPDQNDRVEKVKREKERAMRGTTRADASICGMGTPGARQ